MRFFDSFGISIGIHFVIVEPTIFGSFFECVSQTAVGELICTVAGPAGARLGKGIPYPGHPWSGLERKPLTNAKRQTFGLARRI